MQLDIALEVADIEVRNLRRMPGSYMDGLAKKVSIVPGLDGISVADVEPCIVFLQKAFDPAPSTPEVRRNSFCAGGILHIDAQTKGKGDPPPRLNICRRYVRGLRIPISL